MPITALEKLSQEQRVLKVLEEALEGKLTHSEWIKDGWVNKQYFVRAMYLTQAGRAIWNLENKMGITIDRSTKPDAYGFLSYKLVPSDKLF